MHRLLVPVATLLLVLPAVLGAHPPGARAEEPITEAAPPGRTGIFPLDQVRPGLRGEVVTVFAGTKREPFEIEVVDVIRNYQAKQDVILVRCLGERIQHIGVAQGMSGSPCYIDGKIVGALAYTWAWSKEPLAGITPIEAMLAEAQRPLEGRPSGAEPPTPLRQRPPVPLDAAPEALRPIGTSLAIGGFSAAGRLAVAEAVAPLGLDAHAVGGGVVTGAPQGWGQLDAEIEPGAALVVDLVRGDLSVAVVGTCTWVDGDRIFGFGHPFTESGETLFPLSIGYIYTIVPSRNISFKLGASIRDVGAMVQDRPAGVVGIKGRTAPMVPMDVTVRNAATEREETFHVEISANRLFFQRMMLTALRDLIAKAEGTLGSNTKRYRLQVKLSGLDEPWAYEDMIAGFDTGLSRVVIGLVDRVLNHPMQRAEFEWVKLDLEIENTDRRTTIESATTSQEQVRPGDEAELLLRMRRREAGEIFYERMKVTVPESTPAGGLVVVVTGGDMVPADAPTPVDVVDIPSLYDAFYKSTELVALLPTNRVNLDVGGRLLRNLPLSTLPRLARSNDAANARLQPVTEKVRQAVGYIVEGEARVVLDVVR